jgi:hypothetical protein
VLNPLLNARSQRYSIAQFKEANVKTAKTLKLDIACVQEFRFGSGEIFTGINQAHLRIGAQLLCDRLAITIL